MLIDCTATHRFDANTGIERVVRNVVNASGSVSRAMGLECRAVVFKPAVGFVPIAELPVPVSSQRGLRPPTAAALQDARDRVRGGLAAARVLPTARQARHLVTATHRAVLAGLRRAFKGGLQLTEGDILLLLDSSWHPGFPWSDVMAAQARGARVGLVLYDLIPLLHPGAVGTPTQKLYGRWWDNARSVADFVLAGSQSVLDSIDAVDRLRGPSGSSRSALPRGTFRFGTSLDGSCRAAAVRDELAAVFGQQPGTPTYLTVGVMSPRKNQILSLEAFERLWASDTDVALVIAGRYGWDSAELVERIRRHRLLGVRLFWFEDLNDGELDYAYRHAAALVTTSWAEGFNLPIVEALSRACPVLASDLSVHREVGAAFAAYFPSGDPEALAALIFRHRHGGVLPGVRTLREFSWPDWSESCRELLERVVDLASRPRGT